MSGTARLDHQGPPGDHLPMERRPPSTAVLVLGVIAIALFGWLAVDAFRGSVVYYLTPTEAIGTPPEQVFRLAGHVEDGSLTRDTVTGTLHFAVTDGTTSIPVRFGGRAPDSLTDGAEAVAEGRLGADGVFEADTVLARCASRFEAEGEDR
jgi:cytochrome c-type biogenesis protein CcmE